MPRISVLPMVVSTTWVACSFAFVLLMLTNCTDPEIQLTSECPVEDRGVNQSGDFDGISTLQTRTLVNKPGGGLPPCSIRPQDAIAIVHIGKCAGTSFDAWIQSHSGGRSLVAHGIHADMSYVDAARRERRSPAHVLVWLRDPAARAASNILFWNTLSFTQTWNSRNWSLSRILKDKEALKAYSGAAGDGVGGVQWLSGTFPNGWYVHTHPDGKNDTERSFRTNLFQQHPNDVLALAKTVLERTTWFGILEDLDRSLELLQWQLGEEPLQGQPFPKENRNLNNHASAITAEDLEQLRSMIPLDVELYEYAKSLFARRWQTYQEKSKLGLQAPVVELPSLGLNYDFDDLGPELLGISDASPYTQQPRFPDDEMLSDFASKHDY